MLSGIEAVRVNRVRARTEQEIRDREEQTFSGYNRRGSKDSQLR